MKMTNKNNIKTGIVVALALTFTCPIWLPMGIILVPILAIMAMYLAPFVLFGIVASWLFSE